MRPRDRLRCCGSIAAVARELSVIFTVTNKGWVRWKIFLGALNAKIKILIDFLKRHRI
jgi:hypothetical protein